MEARSSTHMARADLRAWVGKITQAFAKVEESVKRSVDYYMGLPYTVELRRGGEGFRASIKELPECTATVPASDTVEKLWQRLENAQREWIAQELEIDREVPEPPSATKDPFWDEFEEGNPNYGEEEVRFELYEYGVTSFPFRVLKELWLQELEDVGLGEVKPSTSVPPKAEINHGDQTTPWLRGDVRPVRLGETLKGAWIRLDGPRTKAGYRNIEVLDKTLRTEAAIVASLTILEASMIEDDDFKRLREALLEHVETRPHLRGRNLQEVLNELPGNWFSERGVELDEELEGLTELLLPGKEHRVKNSLMEEDRRIYKDLKKRVPKPWEKWERSYRHWERSVKYMVALLRYRRPDFNDYILEQQLDFVDNHRKHINEFLKKQREYTAFLEYGTPKGTPNAKRRAQDQIRAVVLKDVEERSHRFIAKKLGIAFDEERYKGDMKIPEVTALIREGCRLLDTVLKGEGGWKNRAEEMKADAARYNSLSEEERLIEREADVRGRTVEEVRSFYQRSGARPSEFMATDFSDSRPQP